jgi:hypothetical protein
VNSLLGKTRPPFPLFNEVNGGWVYTGNDRQGVAWYSSAECSPNVDNLSLGQLVPRSILAPQVNKSCAPLMPSVVSQRNPFKILWPVVQLIAIDVVDRKSLGVAINKSNGNKPMQRHFWSLAANLCGYFKITPTVQSWRKHSFFVNAAKMLDGSVFVPSCKGCPSGPQDAAILTNKPLNAFLVNSYFFHAVNNTAQHG